MGENAFVGALALQTPERGKGRGKTMRTKVLRPLAVVALSVFLAGALSGCPAVTYISISDPLLEAAIREELGLPLGFLKRIDLLQLTSLDIKNLNVDDLTGLEHCTNLTFFDMSGTQVSDLTPLANLFNLRSLNIDGTPVFECSALAGLINLDSLSVCSTLVTDIQPLVTNSVNGGLGPGDFVNLTLSTLSDDGENIHAPFLVSQGVNVIDCGS